ncbi:Ankyrin repeat domain-containing protein 23 [Cercospora beticola]|uniref:Ankyrin repeat domain-containing protein 23 n=1 Tax=Cercospora beticola TaxID=122368 RepID=A0A2G5HD99_CERBT|nr:Ankyrin repeat domain-containing protein 23 [Cercospora beticola]PIA90499.1 Ankyrin repeat domain-containing protein 23 [Cercospora beticola]WPB07856.1 hypothetical protein RHO25_012520 [Cercospora beticola]
MADIAGALQTADAVAGLTTAVIRLYHYCQQLRKAHELAQLVLEKIEGLQEVLEAVERICRRRKGGSPRESNEQTAKELRAIRQASERCRSVVLRVREKLGVFDNTGSETRPTLSDRRNFVSAQTAIQAALENLTAHKHTLSLWLNVLRLNDEQSNAQRSTTFNELRTRLPENVTIEVKLKSLLEQRSTASARQSVADSASRDATRPTDSDAVPNPSPPVLEPDDDEAESRSTQEALDDLKSVRDTARKLLAKRRTVRDVLPGQDKDALTHHLQRYYARGKEHLKASQHAEAESDFSMALAYSEKRCDKYQIPFHDREVLLEHLAQAYKGLKQWDAAIDIVENEILHVKDGETHAERLPPSRSVARQHELLGALYLERYYEASVDSDYTDAHEHTQQAYQIWKDIETEATTLSEDDFKCFRGCLLQLINMLRSKGLTIEAEHYEGVLANKVTGSHTSFHPVTTFTSSSDSASVFSADSSILRRISTGHITFVGAFEEAVKCKNDSQLQLLHDSPHFDWPAHVNERDSRHETALHYAVQRGNPATVKFLLGHSADIDAMDDQNRTPLFKAVHRQRLEIVEVLLQWEKSKVNTRTIHDGATLLHEAVKSNKTDCAKMLLQADPQLVNLQSRSGQTALHVCAERGRVEHVRLLIDSAADLNVADSANRTSLHLALSVDDPAHELIFLLLHAAGASTGLGKLTSSEKERQNRYLDQRRTAARRQNSVGSMSQSPAEDEPRTNVLKGRGERRRTWRSFLSH